MAAKKSDWLSWETRKPKFGDTDIFIGDQKLGDIHREHRKFDIRHPNGSVLRNCEIRYEFVTHDNSHRYMGGVSTEVTMHAVTPSGWEIVVPEDATLRRSKGSAEAEREAASKEDKRNKAKKRASLQRQLDELDD